jgi:hypothetical protein
MSEMWSFDFAVLGYDWLQTLWAQIPIAVLRLIGIHSIRRVF